ncbi:unnamed protein product [Peniophora sp. CBMAI 1063]|nr:unnamed protein product [Peniophora sp. CBMAI 1063]
MSVPKRTADESLENETPTKRPKEKQQSDLFKFFSSDSAAASSTTLPTRYVPGPFVPVSLPFRPKPYKPGEIPISSQANATGELPFNEDPPNPLITPEMLARARLPPPGPFVPASLPFIPAPSSAGVSANLKGVINKAHSEGSTHNHMPPQAASAAKAPTQTTLPFQLQAKPEDEVRVKTELQDDSALLSSSALETATPLGSSTAGATVKVEPETEPALRPLSEPAASTSTVLAAPKTETTEGNLVDAAHRPFYVIAAHAGAGVHPPELDSTTKATLRASLSSPPQTDAISAACSALSVLEAAPHLNAGVGSNLTFDGRVECDASLMCGETGSFGAVGALSGVPRPSDAARAVLEYSKQGDVLGRVPPVLLVGPGARDFALEHGVNGCEDNAMIAEGARRDWEYWKGRWEETRKRDLEGKDGQEVRDALAVRQDTVGAVALGFGDSPTLAAGVSSGGLLLKSPGRVGEAAVYGAGTWADARVAISVSGQGELIIKSMMARTIAEAVEDAGEDMDILDILQKVIVDGFYKKWKTRGEIRPDIGVLLLHKDCGEYGRPMGHLYCAFTAPSMAIAYATSANPKAKAFVLRNNMNAHSHSDHEKPPFYITQFPI